MMTTHKERLQHIQKSYPWLKLAKVTYQGSGDEGNIRLDSLNEFDIDTCDLAVTEMDDWGDNEVFPEITEEDTFKAEQFWDQVSNKQAAELHEIFDDFATLLLEHAGTGCFDGEGGCEGIIAINVLTGQFAIDDRVFYTESTSASYSGSIDEAVTAREANLSGHNYLPSGVVPDRNETED